MIPTVGRIVHWYDPVFVPLAAIITAVHDESVSLMVFYPDTPPCPHVAPHSAEPKPFHWSWPPRS